MFDNWEDVSPVLQLYKYGSVPPENATNMLASLPPLQLTSADARPIVSIGLGLEIL